MELIIRDIKVQIKQNSNSDEAALNIAENIINSFGDYGKYSLRIFKKSIDARKKENIIYVYQIAAEFESFDKLKELCKNKKLDAFEALEPNIPTIKNISENPPCVIGFGPSGMFCALVLAMAGMKPIVFEMGSKIEKRICDVKEFWKNGILNENSNVQFGEGGAGTFSDGKLMTRISDPLCNFVLKTFVENGANEEIMYLSKPHVGTDNLQVIVKNIREKIISLGGQIYFDSKVTSFKQNGLNKVTSVTVNGEDEYQVSSVFAAIGHSARDTFKEFINIGMNIVPKAFSVGVRIEHLKKDIDYALYGENAEKLNLTSGEYALSKRYGERGVYSFCMCPGGTVIASSTNNGEIVTNGMSYASRNGRNSNSAVAVSIFESDYGNTAIGAIEFQQKIEKAAYLIGGSDFSAPIQTVGDFLKDTLKNEPKRIRPTYMGKTKLCNINEIFPKFVSDNLKKGIVDFERNLNGFSISDAVLTAPETRTSSPVRIVRDENFRAIGYLNFYPCGEGAGYAGGITSAAVDGIKAALKFTETLK